MQIRGYLPEAIQSVEWFSMGGSGFTACFPIYANVPEFPKYISGTTETVSTDSMFWHSRLIAALTDAHIGTAILHDERYQNAVMNRGQQFLYEYDEKVSDDTLVGSAPDITKHFIELRGIGIIDVKTLFGVSSVKDTQNIDLVIRLEDWDKEKEYDRLGLEEEYTEYLGNKVVCHNIPIRPGRNLAIICESAAINHRQKKMGYNAAQELYRRVQESLARGRSDEDDD